MYEVAAKDIRMWDVLVEVMGDKMPSGTVVAKVDFSDPGWVWVQVTPAKWFRLTPHETVYVS